jgi:hypothetical protein
MSSSALKWMLPAISVAEAITGTALLADPALVVNLLLGTTPEGVGVLVARFAGIALLGLSFACWPGPPLAGMLLYSTGVAIFLGCLPILGIPAGPLLWPAVVLHVLLSAFLIYSWSNFGDDVND